MLRTALTVATALCTKGINGAFNSEEHLPNQIIQSLFEFDDYTAEQANMMKLTQFNSLPCTYWFNNSWYDLTNVNDMGSNYWVSEKDSVGNMVAFNFC